MNRTCGDVVLAVEVRTVNPGKPWAGERARALVAGEILVQPVASCKKKNGNDVIIMKRFGLFDTQASNLFLFTLATRACSYIAYMGRRRVVALYKLLLLLLIVYCHYVKIIILFRNSNIYNHILLSVDRLLISLETVPIRNYTSHTFFNKFH